MGACNGRRGSAGMVGGSTARQVLWLRRGMARDKAKRDDPAGGLCSPFLCSTAVGALDHYTRAMPEARLLTPDHTDAYIAFRAEMLADSPWAFGSSPGHDRGGDPAI